MDRIAKFFQKLLPKEKEILELVIAKVLVRDFLGLDVKKLKSENNEFRIRKGHVRIIFKISENGVRILSIERRSDTTYK